MKKTLFLTAILGAALCSTAFGETQTITVGGTQYANTSVMTSDDALTDAPEGDYILLKGPNTSGAVTVNASTNAWATAEGLDKTFIVATATLADETTANNGRLKVDNATVYADIIAGGSNGDDIWLCGQNSHLKGALTIADGASNIQIWSQNNTQDIDGNISAAKKLLKVVGSGSTLNLNGSATLGKLQLAQANTINVNGALDFTGSTEQYTVQVDAGKINFNGATTYTLPKWIGLASGTTATIGSGATLQAERCAYSPATETKNGNVTVNEGGAFTVTGSETSTIGTFIVNGDATIASAELKVNTLNIGSTGEATLKSITLFTKDNVGGSITVDGTLTLTDSISALTAAGSGTINVKSNAMGFTGAGDTPFAGSLNVVAEADRSHNRTVALTNFAGTVELSGRYNPGDCNFGDATKIVLHGDRDNGVADLNNNTTTGFWSPSAQSFSQLIEVEGEHWVDIFASNTFTFNGAVTGDMLRTTNGSAVTFNNTVSLKQFSDRDNAVSFNGDTSIGTLDIASGKTVTFAADKDHSIGTVTGAGAVTFNGNVAVTNDNTQTKTVALTEGNGYGSEVTYATVVTGTNTVTDNASWTLNGTAATFSDGTVGYETGKTSVYYVNESTADIAVKSGDTYVINTASALTVTDGTLDYGKITSGNTNVSSIALSGDTAGFKKGIFSLTGDGATLTPVSGQAFDINQTGATINGGTTTITNNGNWDITLYNKLTDTNLTYTNTVEDKTLKLKNENTLGNVSVGNNAKLEIEGSKTTINGTAALNDVTVDNGAALEVNAAKFSQTEGATTIVNGDLTFVDAPEEGVALNALVLGADATVTVGTKGEHDHNLAVDRLTATGSGATVNANLNLTESFVTLNSNTVELGCNLNLTGTLICVGDQDLATLWQGGTVDLFTSVESVTLSSGTIDTDFSKTIDEAGIRVVTGTPDNYGDVAFYGQPVYLQSNGGTVSLTMVPVVPEPATATLSLLALAALASRRRRK